MKTGNWLGRMLGAAALLSGLPVAAGTSAKAGPLAGWEVAPEANGAGCIAGQVLPDGTLTSFRQAKSGTEYYMVFSNPGWDSLRPHANQRIPIELLFGTTKGDQRVHDDDALIIATANGEEGLIAIWSGDEAKAFRRTVNRARNVTLIGQGREIGTYPLTRLPAVLAALDRCVAGLNRKPA
ncbi:MAG TPA: hypothetical protein PK680_10430 [Novosphingobium sp.]|nr:hypothetical protein [Novosphingobium sp.]